MRHRGRRTAGARLVAFIGKGARTWLAVIVSEALPYTLSARLSRW